MWLKFLIAVAFWMGIFTIFGWIPCTLFLMAWYQSGAFDYLRALNDVYRK